MRHVMPRLSLLFARRYREAGAEASTHPLPSSPGTGGTEVRGDGGALGHRPDGATDEPGTQSELTAEHTEKHQRSDGGTE